MAITNEAKLAEAEAALHDLMIGQSPRVVVDQNGERIEYTAANAAKLRSYIETLKTAISAKKGGPLRPVF